MGTAEILKSPFRIEELTAGKPESLLAQGRELLLEYGRFVMSQQGVARFCFGTLEKEAAHLPLSYVENGGGCLLAHVNGFPSGFVAWRAVPETVARDAWELKRLWVRREGRGLGLGRALSQAVIDRAAVAGRKAVYLDTVPEAMAAAHRLYLDMGFVPTPAFNDNSVEGLAYLVRHL
jgi:GNAT superfamily N-acetyltransferase